MCIYLKDVMNTIILNAPKGSGSYLIPKTHIQHSKAKKTLFLTTADTQQTFPQTPIQSLQTCAIYTHLLSLGI